MRKVPINHIYLDSASTTVPDPKIISDQKILNETYYENADSLHSGGQRVAELVKKATQATATILGVLPQELVFNAGASESNSHAIKGIALANQHIGKHIITSCAEHTSVLESCKQLETFFGFEVTYLSVNELGKVELEDLENALRKDTVLVTLMVINNETGAINDVRSMARIIKKRSHAFFHVDAVQALGRHQFSLRRIDAASFSAHKIYGVKGSGLLYLKADMPCFNLISGGTQQSKHRGGTLDSTSIILFAKTLRLMKEKHLASIASIQEMNRFIYNYFKDHPDVSFNSSEAGTPYIINMSINGVGSEIMMNGLNKEGIYLSAQSTCNSRSILPSHVLKCMGKSDEAALSSIRVSLSHHNTIKEIEFLCKKMTEIINYVQQ